MIHITSLILTVALACVSLANVNQVRPDDPIFDFQEIIEKPLDAETLESSETGGIVTERIEYTTETTGGRPVRIFGILAYPAGGTDLPALMWSQGGMAPAGTYWPRLFAEKGYFCLNVTLPHDVYNSFTRFNTETPQDGNLTGLAKVHMRAVTYLAQRPEVDAERIGVGGTSYGGLFAALVAGADPRIKCGFSFFVTGNHHMGTNYPQLLQLRTMDEAGIWLGTIDPAWRLKRRPVPFLFAVASNDHWSHLPAAVKSHEGSIGEKRLSIAPNWYHAFPENVDETLIDWCDIYLMGNREPYNQPSALDIANTGGIVEARWSWSGNNPVAKAELIVAYGRTRPWHDGWTHRYHHAIAADVNATEAVAQIPIPEPDIELLAYGNITDENGVLTTTVPATLRAADFDEVEITPIELNAAPASTFSGEELTFFQRHGEPLAGIPDAMTHHSEPVSMRLQGGAAFEMKLGHIPARSHKLSLWASAEKAAKISIAVQALKPHNWQYPIVDILRRQQPDSPNIRDEDIIPPRYEIEAEIGTEWQKIELLCPYDHMPIEGYRLFVTQPDGNTTFWIDTIRFTPLWRQ